MLLLKLFYCVIWQLQPCMNHQNLVFKKIAWKLKMFLKSFAVTAWIKPLKSHRHMFLSIISVLSLKNSFIFFEFSCTMSGPVTSQALLYKCCINQLLTWIILTAILQYQWLSWMIFLLILMHLAILNNLVEIVTILRYDCKSLVGWAYKIKYQKQVSPKSFLSEIYSITYLVSHT